MAMPSRSRQLSDFMASIPKSKGKKSHTLDSEEISRSLTRLIGEFESLRMVQRLPLTDKKLITVRVEIEKIMPFLYQITNTSGPPYPSKRLFELREMSEKCLRRFKVDLDSLRPKPTTTTRSSTSANLTASTSAIDISLSSSNKTSSVTRHTQPPHQSHDISAQVQQQLQNQLSYSKSSRLSAPLPPRIPTNSQIHTRPTSTGTAVNGVNGVTNSIIHTMTNTKQRQAQLQPQPQQPQNGNRLVTANTEKVPVPLGHPQVPVVEQSNDYNPQSLINHQQLILRDICEMLSKHRYEVTEQSKISIPPSSLSPKEFHSVDDKSNANGDVNMNGNVSKVGCETGTVRLDFAVGQSGFPHELAQQSLLTTTTQ